MSYDPAGDGTCVTRKKREYRIYQRRKLPYQIGKARIEKIRRREVFRSFDRETKEEDNTPSKEEPSPSNVETSAKTKEEEEEKGTEKSATKKFRKWRRIVVSRGGRYLTPLKLDFAVQYVRDMRERGEEKEVVYWYKNPQDPGGNPYWVKRRLGPGERIPRKAMTTRSRVPPMPTEWKQQESEETTPKIQGEEADVMNTFAREQANLLMGVRGEEQYNFLKKLVLNESFHFVRNVVSFLTPEYLIPLMQHVESKADNYFDWTYYKKLFGSDVINSSLTRSLFAERRKILAKANYKTNVPNPTNNSTKNSATNSTNNSANNSTTNTSNSPTSISPTSNNPATNSPTTNTPATNFPATNSPTTSPSITNSSTTNSTTKKSPYWKRAEFGPTLMSVFGNQGYVDPIFRRRGFDEDALAHPILSHRPILSRSGGISVTPTLELFQICLSVFTNGLLNEVDLTNVYIAGGAVSICLKPLPETISKLYWDYCDYKRVMARLPFPKHVQNLILPFITKEDTPLYALRSALKTHYAHIEADLDIFFCLPDLESAPDRIAAVCSQIGKNAEKQRRAFTLHRTSNSVTMIFHPKEPKPTPTPTTSCRGGRKRQGKNKEKPKKYRSEAERDARNVQLILPILRNLEEHLYFCDIDCTSCAYDGKNVWCSPRFVHAVNYRCNLVSPTLIQSEYEQFRVAKYVNRGFPAQLFELCKHLPRCDVVASNSLTTDLDKTARHLRQIPPLRKTGYWSKTSELPENAREGKLEDLLKPIEGMRGIRWKWRDILFYTGKFYLPKCYVCKESFTPDQVGDSLCGKCTETEQMKWDQWNIVDLKGRTALVTGGRIKIGYQIVLRLLKCGCKVIAVTRFPKDALRRFSLEPDFKEWEDNLHIYGVDLRNLPSVVNFISHISQYYPQIDILINNAAQTIRRPRAYFHAVLEYEKKPIQHALRHVATKTLKNVGTDPVKMIEFACEVEENALVVTNGHTLAVHAMSSVTLTDSIMLPEDKLARNDELFPPGKVDADGEQLDLRPETTWNTNIHEVSVVEMLEVQTINSTVPFMLISQLTPHLKKAVAKYGSAFVINVTSAEGDMSFKWRKDAHPHTNMAKSALNMLTKSIADGLAASNIYTNAADTGWVSLMGPNPSGKAPLSAQNGAARVLDPIFAGLTQISPPYGKLFRNYESSPWQ